MYWREFPEVDALVEVPVDDPAAEEAEGVAEVFAVVVPSAALADELAAALLEVVPELVVVVVVEVGVLSVALATAGVADVPLCGVEVSVREADEGLLEALLGSEPKAHSAKFEAPSPSKSKSADLWRLEAVGGSMAAMAVVNWVTTMTGSLNLRVDLSEMTLLVGRFTTNSKSRMPVWPLKRKFGGTMKDCTKGLGRMIRVVVGPAKVGNSGKVGLTIWSGGSLTVSLGSSMNCPWPSNSTTAESGSAGLARGLMERNRESAPGAMKLTVLPSHSMVLSSRGSRTAKPS